MPGFFVHADSDFAEGGQVLRPEIQPGVGAAKEETVGSEIALRVLSQVAETLGAGGHHRRSEGLTPRCAVPHDHLVVVGVHPPRARWGDAERSRELGERGFGRGADGYGGVHHLQDRR